MPTSCSPTWCRRADTILPGFPSVTASPQEKVVMNIRIAAVLVVATAAAIGVAHWITDARAGQSDAQEPAPPAAAEPDIARGRYIAQIAGCNDCHTPAYAMTGGQIPDSKWLTGDALGWQGPWGTTYPANLRLRFQDWSEDEWVGIAKNSQFRPPMPWFALRDMDETDLRSLYRFVRELGPSGEHAPAYVPPGGEVKGPVVMFPAPPPAP
jgi:mono/diheme cytochrome c family protein